MVRRTHCPLATVCNEMTHSHHLLSVRLQIKLLGIPGFTHIVTFVAGLVIGFTIGRLRAFPLSLAQWGEASLRAWTNDHTCTVYDIIDHEDNDDYHLVKNIDHLTRPTRVVRTDLTRHVSSRGWNQRRSTRRGTSLSRALPTSSTQDRAMLPGN